MTKYKLDEIIKTLESKYNTKYVPYSFTHHRVTNDVIPLFDLRGEKQLGKRVSDAVCGKDGKIEHKIIYFRLDDKRAVYYLMCTINNNVSLMTPLNDAFVDAIIESKRIWFRFYDSILESTLILEDLVSSLKKTRRFTTESVLK